MSLDERRFISCMDDVADDIRRALPGTAQPLLFAYAVRLRA